MNDTSASAPVQKSLQHRTISSAVSEALRRRILDGAFKAGFQLRQDALAEEFGVSRIPIREALMQLEAEGLVRILPHRGAIVSELSVAEIEELFELRLLLEPRLLRLSAPHLTPADFSALSILLDDYDGDASPQRMSRWGERNTELHMLTYRHAGKPRSLALVANLLQECDRHTRLQLSLSGSLERAKREHADLVALCAASKVDEACSLLKAHIEHAGQSLRDFLLERG